MHNKLCIYLGGHLEHADIGFIKFFLFLYIFPHKSSDLFLKRNRVFNIYKVHPGLKVYPIYFMLTKLHLQCKPRHSAARSHLPLHLVMFYEDNMVF